MGDVTLISTFYSVEPFMPSAMSFRPKKIILFANKKPNDELKKNIQVIKDSFGKVVPIVVIHEDEYDLQKVAMKLISILDKEKNECILNITGARKSQSIGLLFGAYARPSLVSRIVYSIPESGEFIDLPKLSYDVNEQKKVILEMLEKNKSVPEMKIKLGCSRAYIYQQLGKMKKAGFVSFEDGKYSITAAGKIARL